MRRLGRRPRGRRRPGRRVDADELLLHTCSWHAPTALACCWTAVDGASRDAWTACVTVRRQGRRAAVRGARLSVRGACQLQLLRAYM